MLKLETYRLLADPGKFSLPELRFFVELMGTYDLRRFKLILPSHFRSRPAPRVARYLGKLVALGVLEMRAVTAGSLYRLALDVRMDQSTLRACARDAEDFRERLESLARPVPAGPQAKEWLASQLRRRFRAR